MGVGAVQFDVRSIERLRLTGFGVKTGHKRDHKRSKSNGTT